MAGFSHSHFLHSLLFKVDILVPSNGTDKAEDALNDLAFSKYYRGPIHPSSLIHPAFVEAFIKRGTH